MPLYEYLCRSCGAKCELLVMSGEKPACPRCSGEDLQRLPSVFSAQGSGCAAEDTPGFSCPSAHKCSSCCHH